MWGRQAISQTLESTHWRRKLAGRGGGKEELRVEGEEALVEAGAVSLRLSCYDRTFVFRRY